MNETRSIFLKKLSVLGGAGFLGALAVLPYAAALMPAEWQNGTSGSSRVAWSSRPGAW